jgi:predicted AAA+ superfamily ATPase
MKYLPRRMEEIIKQQLPSKKAIIIEGMRSVGKSRILKNLELDGSVDYIYDLSQHAQFKAASSSPSEFVDSLTGTVAIDEAQEVPEIGPSIKLVLDNNFILDDNFISLILTGSIKLELFFARSKAQLLAGRKINFRIDPLTQSELNGHSFNPVVELFVKQNWQSYIPVTKDELKHKFINGGIPTIVLSENINAFQDVEQLVIPTIEAFITKKDIRKLKILYKYLCGNTGDQLSKTRINQDTGINEKTINGYIDDLEDALLMYRLPQWKKKNSKIISNEDSDNFILHPKYFPTDVSIACWALDIRKVEDIDDNKFGKLFECFVANELRAYVNWLHAEGKKCSISFWRNKNKDEVDFIISYEQLLIPVEVKSSKDVTEKDLIGLEKFINDNKQCEYGYVVYTGEQLLPLHNGKIWLVPISYLWANVKEDDSSRDFDPNSFSFEEMLTNSKNEIINVVGQRASLEDIDKWKYEIDEIFTGVIQSKLHDILDFLNDSGIIMKFSNQGFVEKPEKGSLQRIILRGNLLTPKNISNYVGLKFVIFADLLNNGNTRWGIKITESKKPNMPVLVFSHYEESRQRENYVKLAEIIVKYFVHVLPDIVIMFSEHE